VLTDGATNGKQSHFMGMSADDELIDAFIFTGCLLDEL
jgi:hypothetical protein